MSDNITPIRADVTPLTPNEALRRASFAVIRVTEWAKAFDAYNEAIESGDKERLRAARVRKSQEEAWMYELAEELQDSSKQPSEYLAGTLPA